MTTSLNQIQPVSPAVNRYAPPGVYTQAMTATLMPATTSQPLAVGIFGMTVGFQTWTQSLLINPDAALNVPSVNATLAQQGIDTATIVVTNPNSGYIYALGTDYTIVQTGGLAVDGTTLYTISRVIGGGHIQPGDTVQVSYQFTSPTYFAPYLFYNYAAVANAYGAPFNPVTGQIQSELTLAAKFAFANGAPQVMCVAVKPTTLGNPTVGDYGDALDRLAYQRQVAVVVCANGAMQPIQQLICEHVDQQSSHQYERRAIIGVDGTALPVPSAQRIVDAKELTDQRVMLLSPDSFTHYSGELDKTVQLGGQYMAASLAGMTAARIWSEPLTRKTPAGWIGVTPQEDTQKDLETQNGLCVVEMTRTGVIRVRHGVTTDPTDLFTREWSVIGAQDAMVYRLRAFLNAANLIGQPIYFYTMISVKSTVEAALQSLIRDGVIVDYSGLMVRTLMTNPDVMEASFGWLPSMPLNYILATLAIDLTTGATASGAATQVAATTATGQVVAGAIGSVLTPPATGV